jgi:hypothetical protein
VNGVKISGVGTMNVTVSSIFNNTLEPLYFGRAYSAASPERFLDGIIDEVRVSNVARSEGWIVTCYNNQHDPSSFYTVGSEETGVANPNLIIDSVVTENQGCTIYANDTYANGTSYYVSVEVTVNNVGSILAEEFNVSLQAYWTTGSREESLERITVSSLGAGENVTLTFSWRPTHTHYYNLTAKADCDNQITEDNEGDNSLSQENVPVTVIGDINGEGSVNIFDAVVISLAWNSNSGSGHWNIHADINHDGNVDILDAVRIGLHWGENW